VAIADFLTEVSLDQDSNGVILDDPVTSLDEKWKGTLARYLVEQAKARQVIVFTHDLSFLSHIKAESEELSIGVVTHWIQREDGQPGFVYLNNSPVCEKDYKSANIANELYSKAKNMAPAEQQTVLQQGFGALRTSYEALIIFGLFNGVVGRFEETISFGRLKEVCIDKELVEKIIQRMEVLSRYIDAHLHSDAFAGVKPSRDTLREEIDAFEAIRKQLQELKKVGRAIEGQTA
jgi:wobble nucleotide-excising tRNase